MNFSLWLESFSMALGALKSNLLRTLLSLLGVTIGIFAIIGVLTFVDALEKGIKGSLSFLGESVIYVQKMPWIFAADYPWWKYINRPDPNMEEFRFLERNLTQAQAVSVFAIRSGFTAKYKKNSLSGLVVQGITFQHNIVSDIPIEYGRYFTQIEVNRAVEVVILGNTVAKDLFGEQNVEGAIDKIIKLRGQKFRVVGILKKQGDNLLDAPSNDNITIMPYYTLTKMVPEGKTGVQPSISIKGFKDDKNLQNVEGEITGLLRIKRGLRPKQEENFALNRPEQFAVFLDGVIGVLTLAGWVIGSFSILVGGFGIANIMFVSVKERTSLIGVQKALGAKRGFILWQFLLEAILLCIIGGMGGLVLVSLLSFFSSDTFVISLSIRNMILGVSVATIIGIIAGIVPAILAAKLDPVEAMRSV